MRRKPLANTGDERMRAAVVWSLTNKWLRPAQFDKMNLGQKSDLLDKLASDLLKNWPNESGAIF
jgi:hypothetical protein